MYVLYAYIRMCIHLCVYASMYICKHVCIRVCINIIFKLGFEWYGGNCPSWDGDCPGGKLSRGIVRGGIVRGEMSVPRDGAPCVCSELNSTPVITFYHLFILHTDCIVLRL